MKLKFGQSLTHSSKERKLVLLKNKERKRESFIHFTIFISVIQRERERERVRGKKREKLA